MNMRVLIPFLLLARACLGGTINPGANDQRHLSYGEKHECVVKIFGDCDCDEAGGSPHQFAASAVVIGPRWIVTAAHVLGTASNVKVVVKGREHSISKVVVQEDFDEDEVGMNDIAVGMSDEDMELDFYPGLYEGDDEVGKVASVCGFGVTGNFKTGAVRTDGRKRAGSNMVERAERHVLVCSAGGKPSTTMEFLISHGDSGGGLFIDGRLAGINSFVSASDGKPDSSYGDESSHTRISLFADWIREKTGGGGER